MIVKTRKVYLFWQTDSTFSNWTLHMPYELNGVTFPTSEHGMMYEKAMLFDPSAAPAILAAKHPRDVKDLGRKINNFDPEVWADKRLDLFVPHLIAKAQTHSAMYSELMGTRGLVIAEASPYDKVWGIGLSPENHLAKDEAFWQGENLLGVALMRTRDHFEGTL